MYKQSPGANGRTDVVGDGDVVQHGLVARPKVEGRPLQLRGIAGDHLPSQDSPNLDVCESPRIDADAKEKV